MIMLTIILYIYKNNKRKYFLDNQYFYKINYYFLDFHL
jgi:hypothetical protein